jgi:hypothetical protein
LILWAVSHAGSFGVNPLVLLAITYILKVANVYVVIKVSFYHKSTKRLHNIEGKNVKNPAKIASFLIFSQTPEDVASNRGDLQAI